MDKKDQKDSIESYYPILQSISFLLGLTASTLILKTVVKKLGVDMEYGFNVYKIIKDA